MQSIKHICRILLALACLGVYGFTTAFASSGNEEAIAFSQWNVDRLGQTAYVGIYVLIFALITLVWITNSSLGSTRLGRNFAASNLFLGLKFDKLPPGIGENGSRSAPDESQEVVAGTAYIRELGLKEALFVSPTQLRKNDVVLLHLDSLPNYPEKASEIKASVIASKSLGGDPENFLVRVEFKSTPEVTNYSLPNYLKRLTSNGQNPIPHA